ncbi:MAG: hypothetical protein ACREJ3_02925 [Polyangiaceae bacterium]
MLGRVFGRWFEPLVVSAGVFAACGCGAGPPRAPTILVPLDQPHAVAVMARVFREFGLDPVRNRLIHFGPNGTDLTLDIASKARRFGIAYITWQDADRLGDDLPRRRDRNTVMVVRGTGEDDDVHAALLFAADYMQDDLSGEEHTASAVAAEQKLDAAARGILQRAEREAWP